MGPFCEGADAAVDVLGADEGDQEEDAAKDGGPEDGAHKVVAYEVVLLLLGVLGLSAAVWSPAGVHLWMVVVLDGVERVVGQKLEDVIWEFA